jgi:chaperonin GroES
MELNPCFDRVVIETIEEQQQSAGGIIIPDQAQEKPTKGKVVAVGKDCTEVKAGDVIIYGKYAGFDVNLGSSKVKVLSERDVVAIILGEH